MGDTDSEIEDMEEDPPQQMDDIYEQLNNARLLDLDPEAATAILALYRAYDPDPPADQRAKYCQMQLSMETDGGRASGSHAAKKVLIHQGDRFVGHRITNRRFTEVAFEDRIKLESNQSLPLPKKPDSKQKRDALERKRKRDYLPPPVQMAQDLERIQAEAAAEARQQTVLAHHAAIADARRKSETRQPLTSTPARRATELIQSQTGAQDLFSAPMRVTLRPLARPLELIIQPQSTDDIVEVASTHSSRAAKHPRSDSAASLGHVAKTSRMTGQGTDSFLGDPEEDLRVVMSQYSRGRSDERPVYRGHASRSMSRGSRSSTTDSQRGWTPSPLVDNSQLFPLADATLFNDDLLVSPEYDPRNQFCSSLKLLQEQHVFFANRMLTDPERNDTAEFLAIGDSMFHHITFESRADLGEAAKVSYSGQRIAQIYRYCSFAFSRQREVIILNIGTNDLLKRFKYPQGPLTVEDCFQSLVAFIEWAFSFYRPKLIMVCTLIPIPKDKGFNKDAEIFNQYIYAYAKSHVRVIVLETALKVYDVIKRRVWG